MNSSILVNYITFTSTMTIPYFGYISMYARTPQWKPKVGYACLDAMPSIHLPIKLVTQSPETLRFLKITSSQKKDILFNIKMLKRILK